jgi:hypothetical protein
MRNKVIEFFQNLPEDKTEQFNKGFELYRKSENKNTATERNYNVMGFSESNLSNLLYDLQKLHNISDLEKIKIEKTREIQLLQAGKVLSLNKNSDADALGIGDVDSQFKFKDIREDYPFLGDEDCPNELKILVADKITAWKLYQESHAKLKQIEAGELVVDEVEKTALPKKALDCFTENQLIHDELNAYKETGKVLGAHPIFKNLQMQREVDEMTPDELIKYKNSSAKYFSDNKKSLKKANDEKDLDQVEVIKERVADRGKKLGFVNKKLGINK